MSHNIDSQRALARRWIAGLIVLAVLLAAAKSCAIFTGRSNPVDQTIQRTTNPVVFVLKRIGEGFISLGHIFEVPSLLRENNRLTQENAYLARQIEELHLLEQENQRLRNQLKMTAPGFTAVSATIIARPYDLWLESAIINVGRQDGVRLGNLVVNGDGVVGKISLLDSDRSAVELITSPQFRLGALSGISKDEGVIRGVDWRTLVLDYVPAGSKITLGEKVFTRGEATFPGGDNNTPRGKLIGTVYNRKVDKNGFLEVIIKPAVSTNHLGTVVVLTQ